ncbi:hypothetical protein SASPL_120336 [Salvia splendens]|uniref:Pectinesterase catalytic domain-containing protein n=1 Tax=Salvia splendens TaxID=180675 RepID=A0A8X8ZV51_SALSN|nr:hypothetical protein SASPL_120336 [Salvia splendens]
MTKVMLVGDGVRNTIITANWSSSAGFTTYSTATFGVDGNGFIARGITFRNTAGAESGQAVALRSASDLSVFYACSFEGYQDTLFAQAQRQLYKSCYIYGTVDVIFGNAAVVIQNSISIIYARKPLVGQANIITAQGRGDPYQNTGISIHNCRILAAPELKPVVDSVKTYLGRPWQEYSRTVVMKSYLDGLVDPEGWSKWATPTSHWILSKDYFGNAAAVLQNCMIYARRPMASQKFAVTAQGRTDPNQNTGISIHDSRTFLGRPWKEYSRTVFMQTYLGSLVDPAGWLEWDGNFSLNTLYYGEYRNSGPGSPTGRRVRLRGYRVITSATEAERFTVANFISGRFWLPATGVPFTARL